MYDLLMVKSQQCHTFLSALMNSNDDELIEDTDHEYWARGQSGHGQNMLGQLLMVIREGRNTNSLHTLLLTTGHQPMESSLPVTNVERATITAPPVNMMASSGEGNVSTRGIRVNTVQIGSRKVAKRRVLPQA